MMLEIAKRHLENGTVLWDELTHEYQNALRETDNKELAPKDTKSEELSTGDNTENYDSTKNGKFIQSIGGALFGRRKANG